MPRDEVPDTSVLVYAQRQRETWPTIHRAIASDRTWLSSVAIAELYAGTRSRDDTALLDRLVRLAARVGRLLTPSADEWALAGRLIARAIRLHGDVRPRDHLADVLILVSAARLGGAVLTANVRHFARWAELAAAAGLEVAVEPYRP
jgi:predicted nucleic acid-binding protein